MIGPSERLLAWRWYWVDGRFTTSDYAAKIYQLVSRLEGRGDPTAWLVLYTRAETDEATAQSALASFASEMAPAIDAALAAATRPPMPPAS